MYGRVVIKLSGEGLAAENEHFNETVIERITSEIITLAKSGIWVSLVVGGGNFWRGRDARSDMDKNRAHQIGMLGTVMNGIYLSEVFRNADQDAIVMTPFDINGFTERFSIREAELCLKSGKVIIFAGGSGHPFFSTDMIAAIRACELKADAVLYAKSIDCVYTSDPNKHPNARRYKNLKYETAITNRLAVADIPAMCLASDSDIVSLVFGISRSGSIISACGGKIGEIGGTIVSNNVEEEFYA